MSKTVNVPAAAARDAVFGEAERKQMPLRANRTVNEILVAELFLVQATIESASTLGESLASARSALNDGVDLGDVLRVTGQRALAPYRERYNYFRRLRETA